MFVVGHITERNPKPSGTVSIRPRQVARSFYLPINGERIQVCGSFFCKTLDISLRTVQAFMHNRKAAGILSCVEDDRRGKHTPQNKTPEWQLQLIRQHINTYPRMESHYCRKTTQRQYLDSGLSTTKMYEQFVLFYGEIMNSTNTELESVCSNTHSDVQMTEINKMATTLESARSQNDDDNMREPPISQAEQKNAPQGSRIPSFRVYRYVFVNEYNLSFFKPKKDQCITCCVQQRGAIDSSSVNNTQYVDHIRQKNRAQLEKSADKKRMASDPSFCAVTFDMQSVLQLPCGNESQLYYKRKLVMHNLTIYESCAKRNAYCNIWLETDGMRGANEIGSVIYNYLSGLPSTVEHVSFFSDSCSGQNRNQFLAAVMMHATQVLHIEVIDHKFLIPGHSQMECDSMHASIEHAKKFKSLYSVEDWKAVMTAARGKKPYVVNQLHFNDFYNLKQLAAVSITNRNLSTSGEKVNWLSLRWLRYQKNLPDVIQFKVDFDQEEFGVLQQNRRRAVTELAGLYTEQIAISKAKKDDLMSLCNAAVIPEAYHNFYKELPCKAGLTDFVPDYCPQAPCNDESEENVPVTRPVTRGRKGTRRANITNSSDSSVRRSCSKTLSNDENGVNLKRTLNHIPKIVKIGKSPGRNYCAQASCSDVSDENFPVTRRNTCSRTPNMTKSKESSVKRSCSQTQNIDESYENLGRKFYRTPKIAKTGQSSERNDENLSVKRRLIGSRTPNITKTSESSVKRRYTQTPSNDENAEYLPARRRLQHTPESKTNGELSLKLSCLQTTCSVKDDANLSVKRRLNRTPHIKKTSEMSVKRSCLRELNNDEHLVKRKRI